MIRGAQTSFAYDFPEPITLEPSSSGISEEERRNDSRSKSRGYYMSAYTVANGVSSVQQFEIEKKLDEHLKQLELVHGKAAREKRAAAEASVVADDKEEEKPPRAMQCFLRIPV
ncbi:hypothetical protein K402DRAFT_424810 [Aulographum hederae CBS 113979]|uniref:Uncharacterized protein n=1 Tax=Aulographum hederae CBS 113979 TaxID=1176131 RepID=A0A6G1GMY4_9PEZI|nr:hypothetical protein K402DRAFT_424810 [Aulographum hederae CBS 113979]